LARVADAVATRLSAVDPAHATGYQQRAAALRSQLDMLDHEYYDGLRYCARREIVVSHAAFGYLAERYGLYQIAVAGLSPDIEPTPRRLADVAEQARAHRATTIFFESLVSPKVAQLIAHEVGASIAVLDPIEGLPAGSEQTYLSVMRTNLATLKTALACP
jgi:zinc transport system substrate-binding protein